MQVIDRAADVPTNAAQLAAMASCLGASTPAPDLDRAGLVELVAAVQAVANAAAALQDSALARLASIEAQWAEDGTIIETVRPLGYVSIDAADLAAPALGATHAQAQRRTHQAVRIAASREPVEDGARSAPETTGLGGLHAAMRDGRLDPFRAGVVAHELAGAHADVAEAVVAALEPQLHRDASALRKRVRALLGRISPELLRQRADRARRETGLRRWVTEPGVDTWMGTFPSEDAATAWAAIDDRARVLVADGVCATLEQARGKALTDLVTAQATVTISLALTSAAEVTDQGLTDETDTAGERTTRATPGSAAPVVAVGQRRDDDLIEVRGIRPTEAALVSRAWVDQFLAAVPDTVGRTARSARQRLKAAPPPGSRHNVQRRSVVEVRVSTAPCHPATGALQPDPTLPATVTYRPPAWMVALVKARDGRCRFPGCSVAARFCDLDHVRTWPEGPTAPGNLACLCRRHHRIKQRPGWRVRMLEGAVLEWTDPTGRVTTTRPQDALHGTVLRADHPPTTPAAGGTGSAAATAGLADVSAGAADVASGVTAGTVGSDDVELGGAGLRVRLEHLLVRQGGSTVWTRPCPRDERVTVLHARFPRTTAVATRAVRHHSGRGPGPAVDHPPPRHAAARSSPSTRNGSDEPPF